MATTPATLKDLAAEVRQLYLDARADAQAELSAAQAALATARAKQTADTATLAGKNAALASKQAQLASTSEVPVDATALLAEIAALQVEARGLQATLLDDGDAVAAGEARLAAAQGYLGRVSTSFSRADAAVKGADADEARRQAWRDALPALDASVVQAAAAQLSDPGSLYHQAEARVAVVPAELRDAAEKGFEVEGRRLQSAKGSLAAIEDELGGRESDDGGPDGVAASLRLKLARTDDALGAWSDRAKSRYDQAVAQLTALAPAEPPARPDLLTPAETSQLVALGAAGGTAAVPQRADREEARADLIEARADAADDATLATAAELDAQGDGSPPASPPDDGAVQAAQDAFDAAEAAYTGKAAFAAWSAAVPEAVWRKVVGFLEAKATLEELSAATPATLAADAQAAEAELAAALWSAERHALTVTYLEEQVNLREGLLSRALSVRQQRLLSALRGDA